MTVKEAFKMLADTARKGMKNPFFIMRNLNATLADVAENIEEGSGSLSQVYTFYGDKYKGVVTNTVKANHTGKLYAMIGEAYHSSDPVLEINGVAVAPIDIQYNWIGYAYYEADVNIDDEIDFTYNGNGGGSTGFIKLIVIK